MDEKPAGTAPWDAFGTYLRNQRHLAQLSLRQLADLTKVSNPYLSQIERGLHRPSIAIIKSLAEALNLSTSDLLAHAADIASDEEATTTTEGAIRNDPLLNDVQKSALLAVYRSMVDVDVTSNGAPQDGYGEGDNDERGDEHTAPAGTAPPAATGAAPKRAPGTGTAPLPIGPVQTPPALRPTRKKPERVALGFVAMGKSAVFIDLDRTLLCHASGQVLNKALVEEGVLPPGRSLPGDRLLYAVNDRLGENLLSMGLVRAAARVAKGWRQDQVQAAGKRAVPELTELVAPFAPQYLAAFREAGHQLVLTTTTPVDMITPFAEAMGFDAVIATSYETKEGRYTGRLYEGFVWGTGKLKAVRAWAAEEGLDLGDCHACSDSVFDTPLLASVGSPHAVNPDPSLTLIATARRWPIEHWDRPPGVPERPGVRAVPSAAAVRPPVVLPLRALRSDRCRAHPLQGACPVGRQSSELLRRGGTRRRGRPNRPSGAFPG